MTDTPPRLFAQPHVDDWISAEGFGNSDEQSLTIIALQIAHRAESEFRNFGRLLAWGWTASAALSFWIEIGMLFDFELEANSELPVLLALLGMFGIASAFGTYALGSAAARIVKKAVREVCMEPTQAGAEGATLHEANDARVNLPAPPFPRSEEKKAPRVGERAPPLQAPVRE